MLTLTTLVVAFDMEVARLENYVHDVQDTGIRVLLQTPGKPEALMSVLLKSLEDVYAEILCRMRVFGNQRRPIFFS